MLRLIPFLAALSLCFPAAAFADNDYCGSGFTGTDFMRNDLAVLKQKMQAVIAAFGQPPAPYALDTQNWTYPTGSCKDAKGFEPVEVGFSGVFNTNGAQQKIAAEYQQKVQAATAKGDYQAVSQYTQEMQAKLMALSNGGQSMGELDMNVTANDGGSLTIDPDSVLRDGAGFIAVRNGGGSASSGQENVTVYFDPVELKDADKIASFDLGGDYRVSNALDLINLQVQLSGPTTLVEQFVKQMNPGAALGQITADRTKLSDDSGGEGG